MTRRSTALIASLCAALLCGSAAAAAPACPAFDRLKPANGWRPADFTMCEPDCMFVTLWIGPGRSVRMAKKAIGDAALEARLGRSRLMRPQPVTWVVVDPAADCATIARVTRLIERTRPCEHGFCHYALVAGPAVREFHLVVE